MMAADSHSAAAAAEVHQCDEEIEIAKLKEEIQSLDREMARLQKEKDRKENKMWQKRLVFSLRCGNFGYQFHSNLDPRSEDPRSDPPPRSGVVALQATNGQVVAGKYEVILENASNKDMGRRADFLNEWHFFEMLKGLTDVPSVIASSVGFLTVPVGPVGTCSIWIALYNHCDRGDMLAFREREGCIKDFDLFLLVIGDIHKAVQFMHSINLAHGDISLENVMRCSEPGPLGKVVLGDFGTTCTCGGEPVKGMYFEYPNMQCRAKFYYKAPEMYIGGPPVDDCGLPGRSRMQLADVFALALCEYILVVPAVPWRGDQHHPLITSEPYIKLRDGGVPALLKFHNMTKELTWEGHVEHLTGMMEPLPKRRFSCQQAIDTLPKRPLSTSRAELRRKYLAEEKQRPSA